jgi:hypothetical protein
MRERPGREGQQLLRSAYEGFKRHFADWIAIMEPCESCLSLYGDDSLGVIDRQAIEKKLGLPLLSLGVRRE